MIELIKFIAETLLKNISFTSIAESKKKKKITEIGTELFILYTSLNEILMLGYHIIDELESYIRWYEYKKGRNEDTSIYKYSKLDLLIPQQIASIVKFQKAVKRLALELQVIAPEVYSKIAPLMHEKGNILQELVYQLNGNRRIKPSLTYMDTDFFQTIQNSKVELATLESSSDHVRLTKDGIRISREAWESLHRLEVENIFSFDKEAYPIIKKYLKDSRTKNRLGEIEVLLKDFRKALTDNFSLQDILLEVADDRSITSDLFTGF